MKEREIYLDGGYGKRNENEASYYVTLIDYYSTVKKDIDCFFLGIFAFGMYQVRMPLLLNS